MASYKMTGLLRGASFVFGHFQKDQKQFQVARRGEVQNIVLVTNVRDCRRFEKDNKTLNELSGYDRPYGSAWPALAALAVRSLNFGRLH